MGNKIIASNRKAKFEYFLQERYEAGLSLKGSEIKSIRAGQVSLMESYIQVDGRNAWLIGAHISPYDPASRENHDPKRNRRLLLNKQEIKEINNGIKLKGLTVVPVQMYLKNGRAKLEIALAKGKKLYDKRNSIAKQDLEREILRDTKKRLK